MEKEPSIESAPVTGEEMYALRLQPTADPGELQKLPLWYLGPALIPIFLWMGLPKYGPFWFALAAVFLFLGCWALLRKEHTVDSTNVNRELALRFLTAVTAGLALGSCAFVLALA